MSNNSLLESLIDPSAPLQVSYFPHTLGWKVSLAVLVIYTLYRCVNWVRHFYSNRHRRAAIKQLEQCTQRQTDDLQQTLIIINNALKECAKRSYPNRNIANLYGPDWLHFLTKTGEGVRFSSYLFNQWQYALYQPKHHSALTLSRSNTQQLLVCATRWVECHVGDYT